jgi:3-hydroxy-9,10-secoandrosta-1,3,5(10)-triene-9,17-dione monooxygenase
MVAPTTGCAAGRADRRTWPVPTDEAISRIPFVPIAVVMLLSLLGLGRAALDLVIEKAPQKGMHHTIFARRSDCVGVQIQLAEAALKLETARLQLR